MTPMDRLIEELKEQQRKEDAKGWFRKGLGNGASLIWTALCILTLFTFPPGVIVIIIAMMLMEG